RMPPRFGVSSAEAGTMDMLVAAATPKAATTHTSFICRLLTRLFGPTLSLSTRLACIRRLLRNPAGGISAFVKYLAQTSRRFDAQDGAEPKLSIPFPPLIRKASATKSGGANDKNDRRGRGDCNYGFGQCATSGCNAGAVLLQHRRHGPADRHRHA